MMLRRFPVFLSVVLAVTPLLRADYAVGQATVPEPVIRTEATFETYGGHPRLFFRDTDLPEIRKRVEGNFKGEWNEMRETLAREVLAQPVAKFAQEPFLRAWTLPRNTAFVAVVTRDADYLAWVRQWMEALVAAPPGSTDNELRGRLQCLAIAYDWFYSEWTDVERKRLQDAIIAHVEKAWRFATTQVNYVSGHSRNGNIALASGLLAIVTERPEVRSRLLTVRKNWIDGYFPTQAWIANEGGYHMGWTYSGGYQTGDIHNLWSSATNECVYFPWQAKLPLFWIYGRQGDGYYANTGDAYTLTGDFTSLRASLVTAAGIFKDRHAQWLLPKNPNHFEDILYDDPRVLPLAPDDPAAPLPLSRNFGRAGVILARDRWDAQATLLQFRSVPFYSANHHHRDENSFTLFYRGPLAIDSGVYDEGGALPGGYGGPHWLNYFTRTVAHNAITVFDPAQRMMISGHAVTNDGGQTFREEPATLADLQPGGAAHLDGITHYQNTPDYTAVSGDATKAYDPSRVRLAQRDLVYLRATGRPHPIVVVFDRVTSAKPEFEKHFLLHTVNEPTVHDGLMVTENHGGRLSCLTLLPVDARLTLVGGPGKEAWVDGANHPWTLRLRPRPGLEPGAWRLEVSPGTARTTDYFLHVLFVDDAGAPAVTAKDTQLTQSNDQVKVRVAGWRITFPLAAGGEPKVERSP